MWAEERLRSRRRPWRRAVQRGRHFSVADDCRHRPPHRGEAMDEESLFAAALEKPTAAERRAFLDEACGDDTALRERLERLLVADRQTRGILERGPGESSLPHSLLAADAVFAGRFILRRKLGEGGMGEVWVADQLEPVRRRVALKVVRPGLDSARLLARFEAERQALALMDHPNIARVLDAGATDAG